MAKADWHHLYDTARWKKLRRQQLERDPLCRMCKARGVLKQGSVADHVTPHKGDERLFFDAENLQTLCATDHTVTKARQEHRGTLQGCDARGVPLDPQHPWNARVKG
jgi:5-methylcytosine-specific restriction enzyme A